MSDQLLIFAGSFAAIAVLVLFSIVLGLGHTPSIPDEQAARILAEEAWCGFAATEVAIDASRRGALALNASGQIALIAPHGAHFSARLLGGETTTGLDGNCLTIRVGEAAFPVITLDLGEQAGAWASRIDGLDS